MRFIDHLHLDSEDEIESFSLALTHGGTAYGVSVKNPGSGELVVFLPARIDEALEIASAMEDAWGAAREACENEIRSMPAAEA